MISAGTLREVTHNYVIWNTDLIKLLSISEDSTDEAKKYFRETQRKQQANQTTKSYNQSPLNTDVDLNSRVNVVKVSRTMPDVPFYQRIKAFDKSRQQEIINRFSNGQVVNEHTGLIITLSKQGLNHILDTARNNDNIGGDISYQAVAYLDELARNAYRIETHNDRKPSATKLEGQLGNLKQVHRFLVPVEIDGEQHVLKLTAKEYETGKAAAKALDEAEGVTWRMDNLKIARKMERKGKHPHNLWLSTGWMRGTDGEWKFEFMDGKVNSDFRKANKKLSKEFYLLDKKTKMFSSTQIDVSDLSPEERKRYMELDKIISNVHLEDVFDAPELYKAYPQLRKFHFIQDYKMSKEEQGFTLGDCIVISAALNTKQARSVIIHEVQHAIQVIEGFAKGGSPAMFIVVDAETDETDITKLAAKSAGRYTLTLYRSLSPELRKKFKILHEQSKFLSPNEVIELASKILNKKELNSFFMFYDAITFAANPDQVIIPRYWAYFYIAGEVEARNAQRRRNWDINKRRLTPLDMSEQYARRDHQLIVERDAPELIERFRRGGDGSNGDNPDDGFVTPELLEQYNQQFVTHATRHVLLDNQFDLKYVGTGEGMQAFGHGIYLEEAPELAEHYRTTGLDLSWDFSKVRMKDGSILDSNDYTEDTDKQDEQSHVFADMFSVLNFQALTLAIGRNRPDIDKIKKYSTEYQKDLINFKKKSLQRLLKKPYNTTDQVEALRKNLEHEKKVLEAIKNIDAIVDFTLPKKGNVYNVGIPDNYELLDWGCNSYEKSR